MGLALWVAAGVAAAAISRFVIYGRPDAWLLEALAAAVTAIVFGVVATALDFGGWREVDWRAGLFAFAGAALVIALMRLRGVTR